MRHRVEKAFESLALRWRRINPIPPPLRAANDSLRAASRDTVSTTATPCMPPRNAISSAPRRSDSCGVSARINREGSSAHQARPGGYRSSRQPLHMIGAPTVVARNTTANPTMASSPAISCTAPCMNSPSGNRLALSCRSPYSHPFSDVMPSRLNGSIAGCLSFMFLFCSNLSRSQGRCPNVSTEKIHRTP